MYTKKRSNKKNKRKINYNQPSRPIYLAPPHFVSQPVRTMRVRTNCTTACNLGNITMIQLAGMAGVISLATGAGSATSNLCDQMKLKRICVWAPVTTAGTQVTAMIKYVDDPGFASTSGPPETQTDTSVSFDRPAYVCLEPPKGNQSIFSQWFDSNVSTNYVVLTCPVGSCVDFWFDWILDDLGATSANRAIVAASVLGQIYHLQITCGGGGGVLGAVSTVNGIA